MQSTFIVNPVAHGGRSARTWTQLQSAMSSKGLTGNVVFTEGPNHAIELAREAAKRGDERVFAVGGDGTVQEIANGLAGTGVVLIPVPVGRGNDFARALGLPLDPHIALASGFECPSQPVDLGWLETGKSHRYFLNIASAGFDAEVAREVAERPGIFGGTAAYLWGLAKTLKRFRPADMTIQIDDNDPFRLKALFIAAGNTPYYAGGMKMVPDARPDDGVLDLCICSQLSFGEMFRSLPLVYSGQHGRNPKIAFHRARTLIVNADPPVAIQADGEVVGYTPVKMGVAPMSLQVMSARSQAVSPSSQ